MLKILHDNYCLIRQILPHASWFSELTRIHLRVADNVLEGTRKISLRHVLCVAESFQIPAEWLQHPISGALLADDQGNQIRQQWLRAHVARYGSAKAACHAHNGLGLKTLARLLRDGEIVSPLFCELVARHTGWHLPETVANANLSDDPLLPLATTPSLPDGVIALPRLGSSSACSANDLLRLMRLGRHRADWCTQLPKRTTAVMVAVAPDIRFSKHDFDSLQALIMDGRVSPSIKFQHDWLQDTIRQHRQIGRLTEDQALSLRSLIARKRFRGPLPALQAA
ncbi:hypothetical protein C7S18_20040 [Ahniella affigens]|uniref:Uncharacterized protein n=1 Tax=Ahniella affigens TaxID=2021234 RepID=A0A2P1PWU3_9GAMM|nr:hypothetical protein [Ahniella affigens]AVP99319.1 hypothetical protein C7S18_20040 [Ahniella affigens]